MKVKWQKKNKKEQWEFFEKHVSGGIFWGVEDLWSIPKTLCCKKPSQSVFMI